MVDEVSGHRPRGTQSTRSAAWSFRDLLCWLAGLWLWLWLFDGAQAPCGKGAPAVAMYLSIQVPEREVTIRNASGTLEASRSCFHEST